MKNRFEEHTNKPFIAALYILAGLNLIGGFIGYFFTSYVLLNIAVIMLIAFIINVSILVSLSWSMYRERDIPLKHLSWLILPSGIFTLLAFLGYAIFDSLN
ncbi:MAG TPA: hypothetical protein G4O15_07015 [Dehalococcoidia bacterium]|nr:hypothetical protein [Dehalococcoidia bacterium]